VQEFVKFRKEWVIDEFEPTYMFNLDRHKNVKDYLDSTKFNRSVKDTRISNAFQTLDGKYTPYMTKLFVKNEVTPKGKPPRSI